MATIGFTVNGLRHTLDAVAQYAAGSGRWLRDQPLTTERIVAAMDAAPA